MKLLLIAPFPPPYGGITNWSKIIRTGVAEHFTDIDLSVIDISPSKRATEGRNLYNRIIDGITSTYQVLVSVKKIRKNKKLDVIHITTSGSLALLRDYVLLNFFKMRRIHTVYHLHFGRVPEILSNNTWEKFLLLKTVKTAGIVIVMDGLTYNSLKIVVPQIHVKQINNPVEILQLPSIQSSKYYMFLGWVIKTKGIEELLSAWKDVDIDGKLLIVGPYQESYLEYLNKSGYDLQNVIFEGEKSHEEAMNLLAGCEAFILPSYSEGCPYVILEAMSLKKPIIATRVGDIPNMLNDECGILIDAHDSKQLGQAIKSLESNPIIKNKLGENAYRKVLEEYSLNKILSLYRKSWENNYDSI